MKVTFSIPDLPYSQLTIEEGDDIGNAMLFALEVRALFLDSFPSDGVPVRQQPAAPPPSRPSAPVNAPPPSASPVAAGTGAYCPEHPGVEVIPSKALYARFEEDEFGNQVQANFFCPGSANGTGKNHNLWRRQLVWRELAPA